MQKILLFLLFACCPGLARAQAPGWSVNPGLFQHSMNLTAALRLDGSPENGTSNVLGAFVGNELRGVATPVPVNGTALYFLTVYSNKTSGETLQFKVYTNADDQTHPAGEMLAFVRGSVAGNATTPYLVNIRGDDDFPISLSNIPGQTRNTGEPFAPIALADYLQSPDGGPVSWSATAGPNLSANVVGSTLTVTATDPNWAGTSTVLVTATETGTTAAYSASKTVTFTVNAALPAPVFSAIPVQHICQITTFPDGDLDDYLSFLGGCLTYSMRPLPPSDTAPDPGWTQPNSPPGSMTLAVRAQFGGADVDGAGLQLAVFVGSQLAGVATPTELAGVRTYFLTAANIGAGDVSFQLYDGGRQYLHGKRDGGFAFVPNGNLKDVTVEFSPLSISVNATTGAWSATVVDPDWFGTLTVEAVAANCADAARSDAEQTTFTRYQSGSCPLLPFYQDADDDGYGNPSVSILALSLPAGYAANNTDCDDTNTDINPAATEQAGDEIDQNCDGAETCFVDGDGDGYRPGTGTATVSSTDTDCSDTGEALASDPTGDCDDADTAFNPAATEQAGDEIDQNCDGAEFCFADADDDGYRPGTGTATVNSADMDCDDSNEALATDPTGDCNDTNDAIRPNATELAGDNVDQNCDGAEFCFADADDDGYRPGTGTATVNSADTDCDDANEALATDPAGDCNDASDAIRPNATEQAGDEIDQNCDGAEICYLDVDDDGYRPGTGTATVNSADTDCDDANEALATDPTGDCNDASDAIRPNATELAGDNVDQNCDGAEICFTDADNDGYRPGTGTATVNSADTDCDDTNEALAGDPTGDCNDGNAAVNPAAAENCGIAGAPGVDDDCDGSTDEDLTNPTAICRNATLAIGANGNAALAAAQINNGSSDNCSAAGNLALSASPNLFDCADAGTAVAVLTVTDEAGRTATCVATVTVLDVLNYSETVRRSASDGLANDKFGWGVAVEGTLAVAGAPEKKVGTQNKQGAAYLFNGSNNWSQFKKLLASDGATIDYFGNSASFDGSMLALGAYGDNVGTVTDQGSAYIFSKDQGGTNNWGQVVRVSSSDGAAYDYFANAVSLKSSRLLAGANKAKVNNQGARGAAYLFEQHTGGTNNWGQVKKLTASDGAANNFFGAAVVLAADRALVSANGNLSNRGAAYIFEKDAGGAGNWGQVKKLTASDAAVGDGLGTSAAMSGDRILLGAPNKAVYAGAAYIFEKNAGGAGNWGQVKKLVAADAATNDRFGASVALSGDYAYVAALRGNTDKGAVYVFYRDAGGAGNWGQIGKYAASDGQADDQYGYALAASGTVLMVGANTDDVGTRADQGSAYFLKGEDCPDASKPEDETTAAPDLSGQPSLLSCSPNPFRDELAVQLPGGGGSTHVKILDATGGVVLSIELPAGQPQAILKTGWLPVGFYFVQVKTADGTATAPVVKL